MTEDRGKLRISNADRDDAIALLKQALDEGRVDLSEFDSRSQAVYEAKTVAELELIFDDLPADPTDTKGLVQLPGVRAVEKPKRRIEVPGSVHALVWVGLITTAIWLASSLTGAGLHHFWPAYPIGILTAITIASLITDRFGDDDDDDETPVSK